MAELLHISFSLVFAHIVISDLLEFSAIEKKTAARITLIDINFFGISVFMLSHFYPTLRAF